jgi:thioester reductase-like protein
MPTSPPADYTLVTGATGLLGRALVRDLAATGRRVAVVVRGSAAAAATERVDELLDDWRAVAGAVVPCPVVLQGDLAVEGLGLTADQTAWVACHVRDVVHSAASLSFQLRLADGEPYTSNVTGTRNVLGLCRTAGIRRLHHVSSAYVCGLRRGTIREDELDVGQESGNDYERSKIVSEREATAAEWLDVCTVYRPSIIVGDLVHGFTTTFHGFYKPLRIVQPFVEAFLTASMEPGALLDVLGMGGSERKNLVPVDWVSAVMTRIIRDESLHGRTYHLTSDVPTDVGTLCRVFESMVVEMAAARRTRAGGGTAPEQSQRVSQLRSEALRRLFLDQMHVYRAYWRDDPTFDATSTRRAVPDLPSPPLDEATLRRLCRFAIANDFRWPPAGRASRPVAARGLLEKRLGAARWTPPPAAYVGLAAVGGGGGQWTVGVEAGRPVSLHEGLPPPGVSIAWLESDTLASLLTGRTTVGAATASGRLLSESAGEELREVLENLFDSGRTEPGEGGGDGRARKFDRPAGCQIPAGEA